MPVGVAAATVAAFAVPGVVGGGQAFASWTPTPENLTAAEIVSVGDACVSHWMLNNDTDSGFGGTPVLAERRGDWSYVALSDGAGFTFTCVLPNEAIGADPEDYASKMLGAAGNDAELSTPRARQISDVSSITGVIDEGEFNLVEGRVGRDVIAVSVLRPGSDVIEASVDNGRFAAWWPAPRADDGNVGDVYRLRATYADGSTKVLREGP